MIDVIDHGQIRELRLARPPANALDPSLLRYLCELLDGASSDGVRALVLSGAEGMFTGGLDVPVLVGLDRAAMLDAWAVFHRAMKTLAASPVPVVAALTGHAPAGGTVLALFCDRRVMADGPYKVGLNEVAVGIPLPEVIRAALVRQVGARRAEAMAVTGSLLESKAALALGLVDEVVPLADVVPRAVAWCRELLELPPVAMAVTRAAARADLVAMFEGLDRSALEDELDRCWFADEPQRTLRALARRLAEKT